MKKKILAIVLCVAMLAIAIVGGTMAYFTDTHAQTNVFTTGKVGIWLDEAIVEADTDPASQRYGDLIAVAGGDRTDPGSIQGYHLFPGMVVDKDPTITVDADSEDAFVAAKVTVTEGAVSGDLHALIGVEGYPNIDITALATGGLLKEASEQKFGWNGLSMIYETDTCVIYQDASKAEDGVWTMYIFIKKAMAATDSVTLFEQLIISEKWDNAEMAKLNGLEILVEAYAAQANGFVDCFTAMTAAFPGAFAFS